MGYAWPPARLLDPCQSNPKRTKRHVFAMGRTFSPLQIFCEIVFFHYAKNFFHTYQLSMCQRLHRTNHFFFSDKSPLFMSMASLSLLATLPSKIFTISIFLFPNLSLHFSICNCNFLPSKTVNQLLPAICMYDYSVLIWSKLYFHHISICVVKVFQCPDRPSSSSGGVEFFK